MSLCTSCDAGEHELCHHPDTLDADCVDGRMVACGGCDCDEPECELRRDWYAYDSGHPLMTKPTAARPAWPNVWKKETP